MAPASPPPCSALSGAPHPPGDLETSGFAGPLPRPILAPEGRARLPGCTSGEGAQGVLKVAPRTLGRRGRPMAHQGPLRPAPQLPLSSSHLNVYSSDPHVTASLVGVTSSSCPADLTQKQELTGTPSCPCLEPWSRLLLLSQVPHFSPLPLGLQMLRAGRWPRSGRRRTITTSVSAAHPCTVPHLPEPREPSVVREPRSRLRPPCGGTPSCPLREGLGGSRERLFPKSHLSLVPLRARTWGC